MAAYVDIHAAATDAAHVLRKQLAVAIHKAAVGVVGEDPDTDQHALRLSWARRVLGDPSAPLTEAAQWIWKLVEVPAIFADPSNASDAVVQAAADAGVNLMADTSG